MRGNIASRGLRQKSSCEPCVKSGLTQTIGTHNIHDCANCRRTLLEANLAILRQELREYEDLKAGRFAFEKLEGISELPKLLICARIASGLTQRDLAGRLELKEQQIQRYEASEYASASFTRIKEVVSALGIEVDDNLSVDDGIDDWPQ